MESICSLQKLKQPSSSSSDGGVDSSSRGYSGRSGRRANEEQQRRHCVVGVEEVKLMEKEEDQQVLEFLEGKKLGSKRSEVEGERRGSTGS
ncbi:hypothetical protein Nepgr_029523 [Nepenthes gracilis]|uniref:Uncharacterized protein n=1 Tax=Nepenthes gracilis TaxID=150966 RepID=A0AAD3TCM8_NEPGR|nr:hypothetical protein Nepgr_029523 [Nepenthes gracilis]